MIPRGTDNLSRFVWTKNGVVVALWGGDRMLAMLDKSISIKLPNAIVVLSWNDDEVRPWCENNKVAILEV